MPGFLYEEIEVEERKTDVHVMGNGTVTAGSKYIDNPDFRVDVIIVRKPANIQKVITLTKKEIPEISNINDHKLRISRNSTVEISRRS